MEQTPKLVSALTFPNGSSIQFLQYTLQFNAAQAVTSHLLCCPFKIN